MKVIFTVILAVCALGGLGHFLSPIIVNFFNRRRQAGIQSRTPYSSTNTDFSFIENCCICLEKLSNGNVKVKLPCGHIYHESCIKEVFRNEVRRTCPICRREVSKEVVLF